MRTRPVILVVDDNLENRQLLGYIFESSGLYQVKYAGGGAEAFDMLTIGPGIAADLIVSDVAMPGMDGLELTRRLRQHPQTQFLPLLLITGMDRDGSREKGIAAGCDDFVLKPFAKDEVLTRVRHLVELGSYRRRALEQTLASHAYETAVHGIISMDATGSVLAWNPAAERMVVGWAVGMSLHERLAQDYGFSVPASVFTAAGAPRTPVYFLLTAKRERRHLYAYLAPYYYSKALTSELGGFVLTLQDFSPVQRFLLPLDRMLAEGTSESLADARAYVACLKSLGTTESVSVLDVVTEIQEKVTQVYSQKQIAWKTAITADVVWHGPGQVLRMIVAQLCDNAVRYSGDVPRVLIEGHIDAGSLVMVIKDAGPGVTESQFNRGSGFQVVRQLVLAVNGMVSLLNPGDPGAAFMIRL